MRTMRTRPATFTLRSPLGGEQEKRGEGGVGCRELAGHMS